MLSETELESLLSQIEPVFILKILILHVKSITVNVKALI